MNCQEARSRMPDLLQDGAAAAEPVRAHLASCPACWQEWQELSETWTRLGLLPQETPSPGLRRGFYRRLEAARRESAAARRASWGERLRRLLPDLRSLSPAMGLAAAVLVVAVGFGAGFFLGRGRGGAEKVDRLSREVDSLQQQMTVSLLNQSSAAARLQGISLTSRVQEPDPSLIAALLDTLNNDPSVNVRLSAVDALYLFADREGVREALTASLDKQASPLVQIALIDLMVSLKEKRAATALKKLVNDQKIVPEVQQRAQQAIARIV